MSSGVARISALAGNAGIGDAAAQIDGHVIGGNPNAVAVEGLNSVDKTILRESLSEVRNLQQRLELDYVR